jgi:hypothetical protein
MSMSAVAPLGSPGDLADRLKKNAEPHVRRIRTTIGKETTLDVNELGA